MAVTDSAEEEEEEEPNSEQKPIEEIATKAAVREMFSRQREIEDKVQLVRVGIQHKAGTASDNIIERGTDLDTSDVAQAVAELGSFAKYLNEEVLPLVDALEESDQSD